jgi:hypothetical protein
MFILGKKAIRLASLLLYLQEERITQAGIIVYNNFTLI